MPDSPFFYGKLPDTSDLLVGRQPPTDVGWQTNDLQIWFNNTEEPWRDSGLHVHDQSDEVIVVLTGELLVQVENEQRVVAAGEFCCFRKGTPHAVVDVSTPAKTFMIRAPSIDDKRYVE